MDVVLHEGDSRIILREMAARGEFVHSVVTDAPYGLVSVTKRFGKTSQQDTTQTSARARGRVDGFARLSTGFMGSKWDGTGIERDPDFWKLVYDVMLPGAYIVAFSSSRTYHDMATAIAAAGFITHPMIGWVFASGMPKDHDAAKAVDRELGVKGSHIPAGKPVRRIRPGADQNKDGSWEKLDEREYQPGEYASGSPEAEQWGGWSYGAQARKPALEPIYVGQKPFSEKNGARNLLKHGVGAVNIDDCRVPYGDDPNDILARIGAPLGRHPANIIHDGSPEVVALFPDAKGQQGRIKGTEPSALTNGIYGEFASRPPCEPRSDTGSAARFFESYPFEDDPILYAPKASTRDRITKCLACNERFAGRPTCGCIGDDGKPAKFVSHPTVKPIALMRALIRHVTPPGCTTLDPFAGSGTTGQAAREEGVGAVLIEAEPEYAADIRRRLGLKQANPFDDLLGDAQPLSTAFDDLLGEPMPAHSTKRHVYEDLLG